MAVSLSTAQDAEQPPHGAWITAAGQRQVLPMSPDMDVTDAPVDAGPARTRMLETSTHRVYVVEFEGETFAALAAPGDPARRIVFDPAR